MPGIGADHHHAPVRITAFEEGHVIGDAARLHGNGVPRVIAGRSEIRDGNVPGSAWPYFSISATLPVTDTYSSFGQRAAFSEAISSSVMPISSRYSSASFARSTE